MQEVYNTEKGWIFFCVSQEHGSVTELFSKPYATQKEAQHMLDEHNKRKHNK